MSHRGSPRVAELHGEPVRLLRLRRGRVGVGVAPDRRGGAERRRLGQAAHCRRWRDALERAQRAVGVARLQLRERLTRPQLLGLGVADRDRRVAIGLGRPAVTQRVEDLGAQAQPVVMRRRLDQQALDLRTRVGKGANSDRTAGGGQQPVDRLAGTFALQPVIGDQPGSTTRGDQASGGVAVQLQTAMRRQPVEAVAQLRPLARPTTAPSQAQHPGA